MKEPVEFIGNFAHSKSRKCENLITEAATILEEYGWRNEFAMYYHKDKTQVRLYLRIAYVASCYLDGTWENIKERIPYIIPLLLTRVRDKRGLKRRDSDADKMSGDHGRGRLIHF